MTTERLGILVSRADDVSVAIGEQLREVAEWEETIDDDRPADHGGGTVYRRPGVELRTIDQRHLDTVGIAEVFDSPRLIAIASRHAGSTGPLLTAHHTGNFGPADHGGSPNELARAAPNAHKRALAAFEAYAPNEYEVGMECTHHGPSDVGAPSLFLELGSGPAQWEDTEAARAVARAILDLVDVPADSPLENGCRRHVVGFGDGHYAPRFARIATETDWMVGHVAADWALDAMGDAAGAEGIIDAAFTQSAAEFAVVTGDRPALVETIEKRGYRVVSETWLRETDGVNLRLVERLEAAVGLVSDGLRFGDRARAQDRDDGEPVVGEIPDELLSTVVAVDPDGAMSVVEAETLAFDTTQNGTQLAGPVAVTAADDADDLLDGFVEILRRDYEHVERRDDEILVRRTEFDPALAREAGVSPGPDFGRLAEGEPVTVDGDRITPDAVCIEKEMMLPASVVGS